MAPESIYTDPMEVKMLSLYWIEAVFTTNVSMSTEESLLTALTLINILKEGPTCSGATGTFSAALDAGS